MPNDPELTAQALRYAGELFIAASEGRTIIARVFTSDEDWFKVERETAACQIGHEINNGKFKPELWRIAPEPTFVPWELNEVPVGEVVTHKSTGGKMIIQQTDPTSDEEPVKVGSSWISLARLYREYERTDKSVCGKAAQS